MEYLDENRGQIISKFRKFIEKIRRSPKLLEEFKETVEKTKDPNIKLILDISTRWNSTFDMLKRALSLKSSINLLILNSKSKEIKNIQIFNSDWIIIEELVMILEPFNKATKALCFEQKATLANRN